MAGPPGGSLPGTAEARFVVLRNGGVLRGQLVQANDFVEVQTEGASIRVRRSDILFDAKSLPDAYQKKRDLIASPTVAQHLELANWCLLQHLWPQAARELMDARGLDAGHPRIALLERRLSLLSSTPRHSEPRADVPGPKMVGSETKVEKARIESDDYPRGTLELFTRRVQPLLVNNCTSVGCHREGGPCEFQLSRALLYGESNQRTTRQNFLATLELIDEQMPINSRLLSVPLRSHGSADGSIFPPHRRQLYDQLVAWVKLTTSDNPIHIASEQPQNNASPIPTNGDNRYGPTNGIAPVAPAAYQQPYSARRGSPRVRFGIRPPAKQIRQPLGAEAISYRITSEGASEPTPQPIVDTGADTSAN